MTDPAQTPKTANRQAKGFNETLAAYAATDMDIKSMVRLETLDLNFTKNAELMRADHYLQMHKTALEMAQKHVQLTQQLNPDTPSGVRAVISSGGKILAHMDAQGNLFAHKGGDELTNIAKKAESMGLTGQSRVDYVTRQIRQQMPYLDVETYTAANTPSKRAFTNAWYPEINVDADYQKRIAEATASLHKAETYHRAEIQKWNEMQASLRQAMEHGQG